MSSKAFDNTHYKTVISSKNLCISKEILRKEIEKMRKRVSEYKRTFKIPLNKTKLLRKSKSFADLEENLQKIINSKKDLLEKLDFDAKIDDRQEFDNKFSYNSLTQYGGSEPRNLMDYKNDSKRNRLDIVLETKDDAEINSRKYKEKTNFIDEPKSNNYFSFSMKFLRYYEDYKILKQISVIFHSVDQITAVSQNKNCNFNSLCHNKFYV